MPDGSTKEPKVLNGHMLPLVKDLMKLGPPPTNANKPHLDKVSSDPASIRREDIGACVRRSPVTL